MAKFEAHHFGRVAAGIIKTEMELDGYPAPTYEDMQELERQLRMLYRKLDDYGIDVYYRKERF